MAESSLVYLVDDDADYRYIVQQVFNLFFKEHTIRFFANGAELVEHMKSPDADKPGMPSVILLDIDMPQMDGFQTLAALRQDPIWREVRVIMMTNRDHPEYRQELLRLGADDFVLKPIGLTEIQNAMSDICNNE